MKKTNFKRMIMASLLSKKGEVDLSGENNNLSDNQPQEQSKETSTIDYEKIEAMINRSNQREESKILKSYFAQQGLNEDEVKEAIATYKDTKKQEKQNKDDEYSKLLERIQELEKVNKEKDLAISRNNLTSTTKELLKSMELKDKAITLFNKTIDESKAIKEDGTIDSDYVKKAMEDFKKEYPEFVVVKEQPQRKPGVNIQTGIDKGSNNEPQTIDMSKLSFSQRMKLFDESKK